MKKLILAATLTLLSFNSFASAEGDKLERCINAGEAAHAAASMRDLGVDWYTLAKAASKVAEWGSPSPGAIIYLAYNEKSYMTPAEFESGIMNACLRNN